jgi:uncharacterized paraquat-inducible protein A
MALVACKECTKQVSTKAVTCPHCGAKVGLDRWDRHYRNGARFVVGAVCFIFIGALLLAAQFGP